MGEEETKEEEKKEEEPPEEADVVVELTEEEKKVWHKKQALPDLSQMVLTKDYAKFSIPEQAEGFDEVRCVWQLLDECTKIMKDWVHEKKMTQRVEDLKPGEWFKGQWDKWGKALKDWKAK